MSEKTSGCVFIKNTIEGAYCLFESVATMLPLVDEMLILDLGSTDGTREVLDFIDMQNPKINVLSGQFPKEKDANNFATLANDLIQQCWYDRVIYWQSDEIWHQDLLFKFKRLYLDKDADDLRFWRIQYRENWQEIKWLPHFVHRLGRKDNFNFVGDGMNTDRYLDPPLCGEPIGFTDWGDWYQDPTKGASFINKYTYDMITDVSQVGGFRDNIIARRSHHAPFWHESINVEGVHPDKWLQREMNNPNWTKIETPFNLPHILKFHVGHTYYDVRKPLIDAIAYDKTLPFIFGSNDYDNL